MEIGKKPRERDCPNDISLPCPQLCGNFINAHDIFSLLPWKTYEQLGLLID